MTDTFLLLTPLLLLPIVALLGFVGCDLVMGLVEVHAPPTAPQSLTATAGDMQVVLHWEGVTGATKYNIYRGTTSNGIYKADYPDHQSVDAPTTDLIDQPLMNGTTYYYIVTTESPYGESPPSEVRPATPTQAFSPSNIAGLTIWLVRNGQDALAWVALFCLVMGMMVSYAKARAEGLDNQIQAAVYAARLTTPFMYFPSPLAAVLRRAGYSSSETVCETSGGNERAGP